MVEGRARRTSPLFELTRARMLEFVRDPAAIFWVFGFPVLLAIVLGIAFRGEAPSKPRVAIIGPDAADVGRRLGVGDKVEISTVAEPREALRLGRVDLLLIAGRTAAGAPALEYRFDPTRPGAQNARAFVDDLLQRSLGRADAAATRDSHFSEPGGRYIDYLLPGLIGLNVMGSCMWGMGYTIVDSRRRKLLKRFAVTPMNRAHFQLSFILSRLAFLAAEIAVIAAFGWIAFGVEIHGSIAALGAVALLATMAFSGLALLVASRTESTEVASGWMNFVQLPMWLFSGAFFDYSRFPDAVQPLIRALPLTAFNDAARAIVNEGASIAAVFPQVLILTAWGGVSFVLAIKLFRWQ
jgi:ABC-2 type transport system permease protein